MTQIKVGDIYSLPESVTLAILDVNGQQLAGSVVQTNVIQVVATAGIVDPDEGGGEIWCVPAFTVASEFFRSGTGGPVQLYPPAPPPSTQVYAEGSGLPEYEYVGSGFEPPVVPGFQALGINAPNGQLLFVNEHDTPHEPPTHAVVQEFEPYLV